MKERLKVAARAALIAFVGALLGAAVAPHQLEAVLHLFGL